MTKRAKTITWLGLLLAILIWLFGFDPFNLFEIHNAGKFGCIPRSSLFSSSSNRFESIKMQDAGTDYYYILFDKLTTHYIENDEHKFKEFEHVYFRSEDPNIATFWNNEMDNIRPCWFVDFKIGICDDLPKGELYTDSNGRYFKTFAFFCGKKQQYPAGTDCQMIE
ncbi:MAG: hypothetical protein ABJC12_11560 [Saprospiraceae bacterium]